VRPPTCGCHLPFALFSLLFSLAAIPFAAAATPDAPVTIRAADVELNQKTGVATYRGRVVLTQGDLTLNAAWLEAQTHQRDVDVVRASGNPARASQPAGVGREAITVEATRLVYRVPARTLDLTDNVLLRRGDDIVHGATGHYDLHSGRFDAHGDPARGERVTAVIHPKQESPAP
jgi:lipopolysaccharide export system protein LptA